MKIKSIISRYRNKSLHTLLGFALCLQMPIANAQGIANSLSTQPLRHEQHANNFNETYILGPGDGLEIELVDLPELSGRFAIGPDGTVYLPRLRAVYVEGLTVQELENLLAEQFRTYVFDPQVFIRPVAYRPIRVYVGGEVKRPGYYTLSNVHHIFEYSNNTKITPESDTSSANMSSYQFQEISGPSGNPSETIFPTVFDAIRTAQGITPYSDLSKVQVTRRQSMSNGGGRLRANLNFLSLITEGDETQNIRLFDGDVVNVEKSPIVMREQLLRAGQTNLTPQFLQVYVSGRVEQAGAVTLPQGSSLVQAVDLAGGTKVLHGKVEFIRFTREGEIDRRIFGFKRDSPTGDYRNPILMSGDVIRLRETVLTSSLSVINEITMPAVGIYSIYSLFDDFSN